MFPVNLESCSSETPQCSRVGNNTEDEVFLINPESTHKKRKVDKAKFPRLSSFNMSALRLSSSSNSEASKVWCEDASLNTDEEMEELRCSPMIQADSPVLTRKKKCCSYTLTPHKPFIGERNLSDDGIPEPLRLSESINDSTTSHDVLSDSQNVAIQGLEQNKSEKVGTPQSLICPPAQCPQRPSKNRRSDASVGGERSCRLLFTKSEDAMKDAITSYGCDAGICVSQTSEKPITPSDFGIELKQGALDFNVQASGSKLLEPKVPEDLDKDFVQEKMDTETVIEKENFDIESPKRTSDKQIDKSDTPAKDEMEYVSFAKAETEPNKFSGNEDNVEAENNVNGYVDINDELKKGISSSEKENNDEKCKISSPKSTNILDNAILENDKTILGLSTPILKVDVDHPKILATPTHDQISKYNDLISIPSMAPTLSTDKYLGNFVSSGVRVLLTPTDSPINSPDSGSNSNCSCSCTECDFSPPSAAKAKSMSQTIESSNDIEGEIQLPQFIDAVMDPISVENKDVSVQENIIGSSNNIEINRAARNESLTSTPKDLTPHSVKSNITAISGISPLPSSTPRPKHKHHHHHHHHHRHHQSMHHLTVHSNSHLHMTSDGDILITSTPLNHPSTADELVKEEISALGSNIDSGNSDMFGKQSRFVMSDLCGSDKSVNHYSLSKLVLNGTSENQDSQKLSSGGGAMYITGAIGSGSLEVQDNKEPCSPPEDACKLHLGTDESPEGWMMDESVLLPRRASSVDETLFRVISQDSPICLSLN